MYVVNSWRVIVKSGNAHNMLGHHILNTLLVSTCQEIFFTKKRRKLVLVSDGIDIHIEFKKLNLKICCKKLEI